MGIVGLEERENIELQEFCRMLMASAGLHRRKDGRQQPNNKRFDLRGDDEEDMLVCVTSGVSFLGLALVDRLLRRGYSVRLVVDNQEDVEKLREMRTGGSTDDRISAVMAKLTDDDDVESLSHAFDGCRGVFHTSAFVDPAGLSGYTKSMAEIEVKASENVMKACAVTPSVRKCVLTSSLLACVWQDSTRNDLSPVINHDSWSTESLCIDKKLWYALGKLRAEKAAWKIAEEKGVKLATICPALITGPEISTRNPTATLAYLKGAQQMYQSGVLATVDITRLAEAHVGVFEAMNKAAFGRYICFDRVVDGEEEAEKLAEATSMLKNKFVGNGGSNIVQNRFELSNRKLTNLLSGRVHCCYSS
ncbi:cinnamoyl-CoA reductase-like SNL6 [Pyrus communis]|uniref:cinnamoyl-CoA reductase-like SNL6 n=1 Tax=Pyrus communis TaxID=23211 RepID=UPI0035BF39E8